MTANPAAGQADSNSDQHTADSTLVQPQTYEITFAAPAGSALRAECDDCEVTVGAAATTLRAELPDQAALLGLVERIASLRLEVVDVHLVAAPPAL
jgi:hypothetical protein